MSRACEVLTSHSSIQGTCTSGAHVENLCGMLSQLPQHRAIITVRHGLQDVYEMPQLTDLSPCPSAMCWG